MSSGLKDYLLGLSGTDGLIFTGVPDLVDSLELCRNGGDGSKSVAFGNYIRQILRGERPWSSDLRSHLLTVLQERVPADQMARISTGAIEAIESHNSSRKIRAVKDDRDSMMQSLESSSRILFVDPGPFARDTHLADKLRSLIFKRLGLYRSYTPNPNSSPPSIEVFGTGESIRSTIENMFLLTTLNDEEFAHPLAPGETMEMAMAEERYSALHTFNLSWRIVPHELCVFPLVFTGDRQFARAWMLLFSEDRGHYIQKLPETYMKSWLSSAYDRVLDGDVRSTEIRWTDAKYQIIETARRRKLSAP